MANSRTAIILAGGMGTRLVSAVPDLPKALAPVAGRPFLFHLLERIEAAGFEHAILAVGHRQDQIRIKIGSMFRSMSVEYSSEEEPLGTGGAIWLASTKITVGTGFFVMNGDTIAAVNYHEMEASLYDSSVDLALSVRNEADTGRYGRVEISQNKIVTGFKEKTSGAPGYINTGCYFIRRSLIERGSPERKFSFERDFLERNIGKLKIAAVVGNGYFIDIGIPADFERAQLELG